ncbi:transposase [Halomonas sp. LR3S48]|uniref:transposase n=1 Tax=Halomonas sp. LR3S48 TaxID=2982694 RepID=UPI00398F3574
MSCVRRLRRPTLVQPPGSTWQSIGHLLTGAKTPHEILGPIETARCCPLHTRLYRVRKAAKGRKQLNKFGGPSRAWRSQKAASRNQEPWLPVNNFPPSLTIAKKLVAIYSQRMQIEEGFRDVKSPLFGLDFGMNQTRSERRIEILLMIAMLAASFRLSRVRCCD